MEDDFLDDLPHPWRGEGDLLFDLASINSSCAASHIDKKVKKHDVKVSVAKGKWTGYGDMPIAYDGG